MTIAEQVREDEGALVAQAQRGDRGAFERLVRSHVEPLRSFLYRMICHPEDAEDLTQETLIRARERLSGFRGEASFRTWLFAIGTRAGLDLLRGRGRWPADAQIEGEQVALASAEVMQRIDEAIHADDFRYEYRQHVAYCLSCVARSLPPEESAALLLKEVYLFEGADAARALSMSESTFRHRLTSARAAMQERFEGLCALIGKRGVCYQCAALRDRCPEDRRGPEPVPIADEALAVEDKLRRRLAVVRETDLERGPGHAVHAVLFRFMSGLWDGRPADAARVDRRRREA